MAPIRVGFIGFGEVASVLAALLREHGAPVSAYDVLLDRGGAEILRKRAGALDVRFRPLGELARLEEVARERWVHFRRQMPSRDRPSGLVDRSQLEALVSQSIAEGYE